MLCFLGFHSTQIVGENKNYRTDVTWDDRGDMVKIFHTIFYLKCTRCGVHKAKVTGKYWKDHEGIQAAVLRWRFQEKNQ